METGKARHSVGFCLRKLIRHSLRFHFSLVFSESGVEKENFFSLFRAKIDSLCSRLRPFNFFYRLLLSPWKVRIFFFVCLFVEDSGHANGKPRELVSLARKFSRRDREYEYGIPGICTSGDGERKKIFFRAYEAKKLSKDSRNVKVNEANFDFRACFFTG